MITFKQKWIDDMTGTVMLRYPNLSVSDIHKYLSKRYDESINDKPACIHNDYQDDMTVNTSIVQLYDWIKVKKPILAGSGTLFFNQNSVTSPVADIIRDKRSARKRYQKIRDDYPRDSYEYKYYDMLQMEAKIKINSIYGSFGTPKFQLYNKYTAESITGTAQSLISVTAMGFESLNTNNVPFKSIDDCLHFIYNIVNKCKQLPTLSQVLKINTVTNTEIIFEKIKSGFVTYDDSYDLILQSIINNLNSNERTHLYYTNNIYAFIENDSIISLMIDIFNRCSEFKNPNSVPESIVNQLNVLWEYIQEYTYYNYSYIEPINRLKNDTRKTAILIDTDSNLVNGHPWVQYLKSHVWYNSTTSMTDDDKKFASINILAFIITKMLRTLLDRHCESSNVLDEYKPVINMKNEFYFDKILLAKVKKRYVASIRLKEGKLMDPYKPEIKGHDFKKASISEMTEKILGKIIKDRIFDCEDIDIPGVCSDLDKFERTIRQSLDNGERTFMLRMNCKTIDAYANPYSQGAVTSVLVWNAIYPDREIQLPDKLDVVLVSIPNSQALDCIKDNFPREYNILKNTILEGGIEQFRKNGIKYFAIPNDYEGIPEFIKPFINYDNIIARNIGTFLPIKDALGLPGVKGKDKTYFSNIIDI